MFDLTDLKISAQILMSVVYSTKSKCYEYRIINFNKLPRQLYTSNTYQYEDLPRRIMAMYYDINVINDANRIHSSTVQFNYVAKIDDMTTYKIINRQSRGRPCVNEPFIKIYKPNTRLKAVVSHNFEKKIDNTYTYYMLPGDLVEYAAECYEYPESYHGIDIVMGGLYMQAFEEIQNEKTMR